MTLAPQTSKYCGSSTPNSTVGIDLTSDRNTSTSTSVSSPKTALQSHQRFLLNSNIVMFTVSTSLVDTLTHVQHSAAVHLLSTASRSISQARPMAPSTSSQPLKRQYRCPLRFPQTYTNIDSNDTKLTKLMHNPELQVSSSTRHTLFSPRFDHCMQHQFKFQ